MKKNLLLITLVSLLVFGVKAQQLQKSQSFNKYPTIAAPQNETTMDIGYSSRTIYSSLGLGSNANIKVGIYLPASHIDRLAGTTITHLKIGIGTGTPSNGEIFLSYEKDSTPFYNQSVTFNANTWNNIELTTPYTIEAGKGVFIGYSLKTGSSSQEYPIGIASEEANEHGDYIYYSGSWTRLNVLGASSGINNNLCILATVTGDNLPQFDIDFIDAGLPSFVKTNSEFKILSTIRNIGASPVTSFDLKFKVGDNTEIILPVNGINILNLDKADLLISGLNIPTENLDESITLTIDNINGNADIDMSNNTITDKISALETVYPRKYVAEEATGTWCGWCPRGIVSMATMKEKYPDLFIGIAVHGNSNNAKDPMTNTIYNSGLGQYFSGYPSAVINRSVTFNPGDLEKNFALENLLFEMSSPFKVDLSANFTDDTNKEVKLTANIISSINQSETDLRFAFVVIENEVTGTASGYAQTNYYTGGSYGAMGGFEKLSDPVPASQMKYDDVARLITNQFTGIANSIPTNLEKDVPVSYDYTLKFPTSVNNVDNTELIVLLLNNSTGEILNAAKIHAHEIGTGIADEIVHGLSTVVTKDNSGLNVRIITEEPQFISVDLLSLNGKNIISLPSIRVDNEHEFSLPVATSGAYIVKIKTKAGVLTKKAIF